MLKVLGRVAGPLLLLWAPPPADAAERAPDRTRPDLVEQGLAPAVVLEGRPVPRRTIAAEMDRLHVPGVSIAVLNGGRIAWAKGYGTVRAEGPPVTPETLFQAGSISKPVAALAALRLVQQHRLSLDGDVNDQLPSWKVAVPPGIHVTLRQLLSHTAGATVHGFPGYAAGTPVPTVEQVLSGRPPTNTAAVVVDTAPGTAWR